MIICFVRKKNKATIKIVVVIFLLLKAPPPEDGDENKTPKPVLDSGGFLTGLVSTVLGGSSGGNGVSLRKKKLATKKNRKYKN